MASFSPTCCQPRRCTPAAGACRLGAMRICSLLPSATEILFALGLGDSVAGVTHECDYPPAAATRPVVVRPRVDAAASPAEVDRAVNEFAARGESIYRVDAGLLRAIEPDLIL